jgi:hypothetical protein
MMLPFQPRFAPLWVAGALAVCGSVVQAAPAGTDHVRGTIAGFQGQVLTVKSAGGSVRVLLTGKTPVISVVPSDRAHIKDGTFLGIASLPQPNGSQRALEVVVFPEAARGTGEGSYAWDLPGSGSHSKMTNGMVSRSKMTNGTASKSRMTNGTVHTAGGAALTLQYKTGAGTGSQNIILPPNIPIVTFAPGQPSQLTPGAHVFIIGRRLPGGIVAADRVLVGKNGLVPPM